MRPPSCGWSRCCARRGVRLKFQVTSNKGQGAEARLPRPRANEDGSGQKAIGRQSAEAERLRRPATRAQSKDRRGQGGLVPVGSVSSVAEIRRTSVVVCHRPSPIRHRPFTVKPDFVFRKERLVVFVDGCFWHGCPLHYTRPKTRRAFWDAKIAANRARDRRIDRALRAGSPRSSLRCGTRLGWRVLHLWEHALAPRAIARTLARVKRALGGRVRAR